MKLIIFLAGLILTVSLTAMAQETNHGSVKKTKKYKDATVEEFDKLRGDKKNVLVDVRTPEEFAEGHIPGAININVNSPEFAQKVGELDKGKTYLVNCAAGGRSAKACARMADLKFEKCYNLLGGFSEWEKAGKPIEK